jgi:uncharacterized membrane protein
MDKYVKYSYALIALSSIGFGIIQLVTGDFNKGLLPVPATISGRAMLAYLSGGIFIISGFGIFINKWRHFASYTLAILLTVFFVAVHLPKLVSEIYNPSEWTACFEVLVLCSGAYLISIQFRNQSNNIKPAALKTGWGFSYMLALSYIVFGFLHFKYAEFIATLIPSWIPGKMVLGFFIGAAFCVTALSIFINVQASLSTALIGVIFLIWVLILHTPRAISNMNAVAEWTSLLVALGCSGASFMLSYFISKKVLKLNVIPEQL